MTITTAPTTTTIARTDMLEAQRLRDGNGIAYLLASAVQLVSDPKIDKAKKRQAIDDVLSELKATPQKMQELERTTTVNAFWLTLTGALDRTQIMSGAAGLGLLARRVNIALGMKDKDDAYALIESAITDFNADTKRAENAINVAALSDLAEMPPFEATAPTAVPTPAAVPTAPTVAAAS